MTFDPTKVQMSSETSSLKILAEDSGSLSVPSTSSSTSVTNTVVHNFGSDELLWQVGFTIVFSGGGTTTGLMTPWISSDGQTTVVSTVDSNNLYITGKAQTAGSPTLAYTINYAYRILVP